MQDNSEKLENSEILDSDNMLIDAYSEQWDNIETETTLDDVIDIINS